MALRTEVTRTVSRFAIGQSVVFFGNETLATGVTSTAQLLKSLLDYGHTVEAVVLSGQPDRKRVLAIEQVAQEHAIEVAWVTSRQELNKLTQTFTSEIAVLASFGMIIPRSVIDHFRFGIVNVHPSLLPIYRGSSPIEQTILDGLDTTGYSLMQLDEKMDEGPLFLQEIMRINPTITKQELHDALAKQAADRLPEAISQIVSGSLTALPQTGTPSYTQRLTKQDGVIDWTQPADHIERQIRAYAGWPKSRTTLGGIEVIVLAAHDVPSSGPSDSPGDVNVLSDVDVLMVTTGNGTLCIDEIQPAGKKPMSASAFINGYGQALTPNH